MKLLQEIDSLTQIDIEALMSRGLREGPQLEYKETLLPLSDQKKFELLKDVSSMANSEGGVIVFGVKQDQTGAPTSLLGLEIENVDELHNRLDQILNDNLDERLSGLRHRAIPRSDGKYFYVIQVPASYLAPHMITMPSTKPRFYLRVNTVNAPMNAQQIKDASLRIERAQNRAIGFVQNRIEWNARFSGAGYIFHIVPLYSRPYNIDLTNEDTVKSLSALESGYPSHSVHGLLIKNESEFRREHVLITREGAFESFRTPIAKAGKSNSDVPLLALTVLEREILKFANAVAKHPHSGLAELPALIGLTLVGMKGVGIWDEDGFPWDQTFDEDQIALEPVILQDWSEMDAALKNFFDVIWQSFGTFGSPNYDERGARIC
jgi:hypothetical protein